MGLSRSTYYDVPSWPTDDAALAATRLTQRRADQPLVTTGGGGAFPLPLPIGAFPFPRY